MGIRTVNPEEKSESLQHDLSASEDLSGAQGQTQSSKQEGGITADSITAKNVAGGNINIYHPINENPESKQMPKRSVWPTFLFVLLLLLIVIVIVIIFPAYLNMNHAPSITGIVPSEPVLRVDEKLKIRAIVTDKDNDKLEYFWSAERGLIPPDTQGDTIIYTAPNEGGSGFDRITVTVTDGKAKDIKKFTPLIRDY